MKNRDQIVRSCRDLIISFKNGGLGQTEMPENSNPFDGKSDCKEKLSYFTFPMALNYQRNSYDLWRAALKTWNDVETRGVFDSNLCVKMTESQLREKLMKHKLALQPNKHVETWQRIAKTIVDNWGSIETLLEVAGNDYLRLSQIVQKDFKSGFPYLSGPKIFNYWCYILSLYCGVDFKNADRIEIAPDTHITKCSVRLGVITEADAASLTKEQISLRWREVLQGSGINPIDMHAPLWFWSRNGFLYLLKKEETDLC